MRKLLGAVVVALLLVGCGGGSGGDGGGDTDGCDGFARLEALVKPDGFNFDQNNDGYLNMAEQFNEVTNDELKQDVDDLRETYADC